MMFHHFKLSIILLAVTIIACTEYHPYDTHFNGQRNINSENIKLIEKKCQSDKNIKFVAISDSQRWYDELEKAVEKINKLEDVDFVIHLGDIADFGMSNEFELQRNILNHLSVPYVCIIGNHDCLATGELIFREMFGEYNFAFQAGDVRFLYLNTNALEFDLTEDVPDLSFINEQVLAAQSEKSNTNKCVVAMHAQPYSEQFNNNLAEVFQHSIRQLPNLQFCVHGHGHNYRQEDIFSDGVTYYQCDNIGKQSFLVFEINGKGYECKRVFY